MTDEKHFVEWKLVEETDNFDSAYSTMKMESVCSSETLVDFHPRESTL
jgi:hypothetical protein